MDIEGWKVTIEDGWFVLTNRHQLIFPPGFKDYRLIKFPFTLRNLMTDYSTFGLKPTMLEFPDLRNCCAVLANFGAPTPKLEVVPRHVLNYDEGLSALLRTQLLMVEPQTVHIIIFFLATLNENDSCAKILPTSPGETATPPDRQLAICAHDRENNVLRVRGTAHFSNEEYAVYFSSGELADYYRLESVELSTTRLPGFGVKRKHVPQLFSVRRISEGVGGALFRATFTIFDVARPPSLKVSLALKTNPVPRELVFNQNPAFSRNALGCKLFPICLETDRYIRPQETVKVRVAPAFVQSEEAVGTSSIFVCGSSDISGLYVSPRVWFAGSGAILHLTNVTEFPIFIERATTVALGVASKNSKLKPGLQTWSPTSVFFDATRDALIWSECVLKPRESGLVRLCCVVRKKSELCPEQPMDLGDEGE